MIATAHIVSFADIAEMKIGTDTKWRILKRSIVADPNMGIPSFDSWVANRFSTLPHELVGVGRRIARWVRGNGVMIVNSELR